jgi:ribokinase
MKNEFITIGGTTRDISFFDNHGTLVDNCRGKFCRKLLAFEPGAKIKVDKFYYSYGGGAANAAVCLANFGFKVSCLAPIGDDENGRFIKENLKKRRVDISLMRTIKREESGSSFILVSPTGERIIFAQRGANVKLKINSSDLESLKKTKYVYIASLAGGWRENLRKIFSAVGHNHHWIFWNPGTTQYLGGPERIAPFLKKVTVLASNQEEAQKLLRSSKKYRQLNEEFLNNPDNLVKILHDLGPKIVIITLGAAGVIVYDGKKFYRRNIIKEKRRVDTTGIGDIFNSSFAAGLALYKGDINKALRLGLKNAALKVAYLGAHHDHLLKLKDIKVPRPKNGRKVKNKK